MLGSTRAEVQEWKVDVAQGIARIVKSHNRQLERMDMPLRVEPLAAEIANAILEGRDDSRLEWINSNRDRVRILTGKIIPTTYQRTATGRRKRFIIALDKQLAPHGWRRIMVGTRTEFEKKTPDSPRDPMP